MRKTVASFSVPYLQILNEKGVATPVPKLAPALLKNMYRLMMFSRLLDEKCLALQRQGRIGTYASVRGQEAAQVGSALALQSEDWIFPAFRETAANITRGLPPEAILLYWGGTEWGEHIPEGINNFTVSIPVSSHLTHAVGTAWGMKIAKKKTASVVYFGDGATSKGDFHEAMNWAGVFAVPCIFICQNNQWAISIPVSNQTHAETIAQKAIAYGVPGIRVDGNDVIAMYQATKDALERAYAGKGPTLIEAFTYRVEHHTTADDWTRYRTKAEVDAWIKKDPIARLELYLRKKKLLTEDEKSKIRKELEDRVEEAVKKLDAQPTAQPEEMFDFVFAEPTPALKEQKEQFLQEGKI